MIVLFTGLSCYFFYDWKIGYPKKNYVLVQYDTFEKAREYFLEHHKKGRTPEQWTSFVKEQEIVYFTDKSIVEPNRKSESWPSVLHDYDNLAAALASPNGSYPALWEEFYTENKKRVIELQSSFSDPPSKDDRKTLKAEVRWDLPMPTEYKKGEYDANYRLLIYKTFEKAEAMFQTHLDLQSSKDDWEFLTSCKNLAFEEDRSIVPESNQKEKWPAILGDYQRYYELAKADLASGISVKEPYLWKEFTSKDEKDWDQKPPKDYHDEGQVKEQLYFGIGVLALSSLAGLFALWMKNRFMAVDEEAFYAPGNIKIPYSEIYKIDKRKWETKGLATLYYKESGQTKKARVDGMVYGQFDKEQGEPAEKLFQTIMKHFKGEVVEFIAEEETEQD